MICSFAKLYKAVLGIFVLGILLPINAWAANPPVVRLIEGTAISPSAAITELGSATTHTNSTVAARHSEIVEIADSLKDDIDLIYQYIYDNIETIPAYGLKNGALGALIDGKGTPFDQAHLMYEMAVAAGYNADYRFGTATLTATQFSDLFGTESDREACELMRDGGFGMTVDGSTNCSSLSSSTATKDVAFVHVWLRVYISSTYYYFDPSIKTQTEIDGWDIGTKMGYNDSDFWTKAGVLTGTEGGAHYVYSIDKADIETELKDYAGALVTEIQKEANHDLSVTDIAGGREIEPAVIPAGGLRQTEAQLGHTVSLTYSWLSTIPDQHRTKVKLTHNGSTYTFYADDLYGRRLWLQKSGTALRFIVGTKEKFSKTYSGTLSVEIDHPYAASSGALGDHTEVFNPPFQNGATAALVLSVGPTGPGLQGRYSNLGWQQLTPPSGFDRGEDAGAVAQMALGASWLAQATLLRELNDGVNDVRTILHDSIGLISGEDGTNIEPMADIRDQIALTDPNSTGAGRTAAIQAFTSALAALEGAVLDQIADTSSATPNVAGVPGLFLKTNDAGKKFYDVTSSNWTGVQAFLTDYSAGELSDLDDFLTAGYRLILPKDGNLSHAGFTGVAYLALKNDDEFGHLLDESNLTNDSHIKASVTDEATYEQEIMDRINSFVRSGGARTSTRSAGARSSATDLVIGTGGFPYALAFTRSFRPDAADGDKNGWTHNFDITGKFTSDGSLALGAGSPVDAARAMAALYIAREVLETEHSVERIVTGLIIQDWLHRGLYNNIFKITQGHASVDFVKLADGTFNPPDGDVSSFTTSGSGATMTAKFTAKSGVEMNFDAVDAAARDFELDDWTWPSGMVLNFTYPTATQMKVENDYGRSLTIDFDTDGNVTKVTDDTDRYVDYTYSGNDITKATLHEGASSQDLLSYTYSSDVLWKVSTPENTNTITYTHNPLDQVTAIDRLNAGITNIYENSWRTEIVDPSGASRVVIVDPYGRWVKATDGLGNVTTTTFDRLGRTTKVEAPESNAVEFTYDKWHNRLTAKAKAKSGSGLSDQTTTFTYENATYFRQLKTATDPLSKVTSFEYFTTSGLLKKVTLPSAPVFGGSPASAITTYTYNSEGQLTTVTDPDGVETTLVYNVDGELTSTEASSETSGLGIDTTFTYTSIGDLASVANHRGDKMEYEYDMLRRRTEESSFDITSHVIAYTYDQEGRLTDIDMGSGLLTSERAFDARGRLTSVKDTALKTTTIAYDDVNRHVTVTDPLSRQARTVFDAAGRRIEIVSGLGSADEAKEYITYNDNGTVATVKDGEGNITSYTYDGFDRLIKTTYPAVAPASALFEEVTSFDAMGRPLTQKTRDGDTITLTYDARGRLESRLVTGGTQYDYKYDIRSLLMEVKQGSADVDYTYDKLGRIKSETGVHGREVEYDYLDSTGRTTVKYNLLGSENDFSVYYYVDALGRTDEIKTLQTSTGFRTLASHTFDAVSRVTKLDYDISGYDIDYTYDTAGRLDTLAHDFTGTTNDVTLDYTRNDAGQVTAKDFTDNDYIWSPPANGTDTYVATALNQFSSVPAGTPTYDNNGNMTYDGVFTFIYDAENRLTQAKNGATVLGDYEYDPLGRRSKKTVKPATDNLETEYLYAGAQVLAEYDGATGDLLRRYVYAPGIDDPIAILNEAGDVTYFHSDGLGSIIALSDDSGANTDIFTHGPFGEVDTNSGGSAYKYTARRIDEETGLYYYRNRYYHPEIGRFMSADPIGYGAGLNMYAYVGNDPMNYTDPWGLYDVPVTCTGSRIAVRSGQGCAGGSFPWPSGCKGCGGADDSGGLRGGRASGKTATLGTVNDANIEELITTGTRIEQVTALDRFDLSRMFRGSALGGFTNNNRDTILLAFFRNTPAAKEDEQFVCTSDSGNPVDPNKGVTLLFVEATVVAGVGLQLLYGQIFQDGNQIGSFKAAGPAIGAEESVGGGGGRAPGNFVIKPSSFSLAGNFSYGAGGLSFNFTDPGGSATLGVGVGLSLSLLKTTIIGIKCTGE